MGDERGNQDTSSKIRTRPTMKGEVSVPNEADAFRVLFETMIYGAVFQDAKGKIILANSAAERILGLTRDQMMGRESVDPRWNATRINGSDYPGTEHPAMIALKTGKAVNNQIMGVFNPFRGERRWIVVNAIPLYREGERRPFQVYTTFSDETQRINAEENLRLYNHMLQHDLRNDLQIMMSHIDAVEVLGLDTDDIISDLLKSLRATCTRMTNLVGAMNIESEISETKLIDMLRRIADSSEEIHKGLKVIVKGDSDTESISIPSHRLLANVFHNLMRNAAQYCGKNPVVILQVAEKDDRVLIRVSDNGPGIPKSIRSSLFMRGVSTNGGGLGLFLTREILRACGGDIRLEVSGIGEGAVFMIDLPVDRKVTAEKGE